MSPGRISPTVVADRRPHRPSARLSRRSRITGSGTEAPDQLLANPSNWRTHPKAQRAALREVLDTVDYVAQVVVNQRTGHLVDGHLRVEEALSRGQPSIPVQYVDFSEEEERLVLTSLDPLAAMATNDETKLRELLAEASVDSDALAAMLAGVAPAEPKDGGSFHIWDKEHPVLAQGPVDVTSGDRAVPVDFRFHGSVTRSLRTFAGETDDSCGSGSSHAFVRIPNGRFRFGVR